MKKYFIIFFSLAFFSTQAQESAKIFGVLSDSLKKPLAGASIAVAGLPGGTVSNEKGEFVLTVPAGNPLTVTFSLIGFQTEKLTFTPQPGEKREIRRAMRGSITQLPAIEIQGGLERGENVTRIDARTFSVLPNANGNFESLLKTLPGVTSNNELSSQYSVRGGNYDENLVYVNDIEVYRPFLVRSGQQEGLSFINSDMTSDVLFSAGGFDAKYGDKTSSVLDIKYKKPTQFGGSGDLSLLGGSLTLEGSSKNKKLTFLGGFRQKSNQYVLNSLDTKGDYKPSFTDLQTYITYAFNDKTELSFLGNYSSNVYNIVPQDRETVFGTVNEALRLKIFFLGQEIDQYQAFTGALALNYQPTKRLKLKLITSAYHTDEHESFDIEGQYYIDELGNDLGKASFGKPVANLGVGTYLNHTRTNMSGWVRSLEHKGYYNHNFHYFQWGARYQHEELTDNLSEWKMIDSAEYNLPKSLLYFYPVGAQDQIVLQNIIRSQAVFSSNRYSAYVQDRLTLGTISLTGGLRSTYWDLNRELNISPRGTISYKPEWKTDIVFRASAGYYFQPPFYKELRALDGTINTNIKAQESIHFVLGSDYQFKLWERPFKLASEAYYKILNHLNPYVIDNVQIKYLGNNNSSGYARGVDLRINGEFVKGLESWASLSLLDTKETVMTTLPAGDSKKVYIPRPNDQRFTFSLFFQDYLPKHPSYKVHLAFVFGTGLPFGPPTDNRAADTLRVPPYERVDIGFSKQILGPGTLVPANMNFLKGIKSMWLSLEVFNLFQVNNTVSYLWFEAHKNGNNLLLAVPNYLTSRQINARLVIKF